MSLFYKKMQRANPRDPQAPKLWYPILKSVGLVREKEVGRLLAEETTLNPKEAEMTLYQLLKVIIRLLLDGHTVQLGELGTFRLVIRTEGSENEADANASKIKNLLLQFVASATVREQLKHASYKDVTDLQ
ncbi:MAG: HU family DNA-binding protein [Tannerella sp.]|jgi:predicted histone-like DNA-binding protein|nr:HU family DNA-binding protein [Tannerella sp.]